MAADSGSVIWVRQPLTRMGRRIAGSDGLGDGGSVFCGGEPLTEKKGSRAQDGLGMVGVCFVGGEPLTQSGGKSRAQHNRKEETAMIWDMFN